MDIPVELQRRLDALTARHASYSYRGPALSDKTLVAIIAPTAVGKSTLVAECLRLCAARHIDAGECGTTTTRERRVGDDPPNYITANEGVTFASMIEQIENGELVNWSLHGTGHLYGTAPENFSHEYNFLPLIPDSLPMMQTAGLKRVVALYLAIDVDQWKEQLRERMIDPRFSGRMQEALSSLEFARAHSDSLIILDNRRGPELLEQRATKIIDALTLDTPLHSDNNAPDLLATMLAYAKEVANGRA